MKLNSQHKGLDLIVLDSDGKLFFNLNKDFSINIIQNYILPAPLS